MRSSFALALLLCAPVPPMKVAAQAGADCSAVRPNDHQQYICLDLTRGLEGASLRFNPDSGLVLPPNKDIIVLTRHSEDETIAVTLSGTRGLYMPAPRGLPPETPSLSDGSQQPQPAAVVTQHVFAPRTPGALDLVVTSTKSDGQLLTRNIELIVDQVYSGAIRVGLGVVSGAARERGYALQKLPGATEQTIAQTRSGATDFELTIGYSAYLDRGGRSQRKGCDFCISPYVGIGVYAPQASGIDFLKSLYLGADIELQPSLSLAAALVLRRVQLLQHGVSVGEVADSVPMREVIRPGFALVLSFSPELLKLARPSVAGLIGRAP